MHPLKVDQPYPYNCWWVAAYSSEVTREILGQTILGERVIFYRTEAGEAVAMAGICPHRSFPLANSWLVGDAVQCGYHGFMFDQKGTCTFVPSQPDAGVPTNSALRRYPLVERGGVIWIWTGQEELADPALLPDTDAMGLGMDGWTGGGTTPMTVPCRYMLLIDNLLDLSHASFIHRASISGAEALVQTPVTMIETDASINVERKLRNAPVNPLLQMQFPDHEGLFDQHADAEYVGPALCRTGGHFYRAGEPEAIGTENFLHFLTPETPTSTHYRVMIVRNFQTDNAALTDFIVGIVEQVLPEDKVAVTLIEQVLQDASGPLREVSQRIDNGALKVRRRLEAQIRQELPAG